MSHDHDESLTSKQHKAVYALLEQPTIEAAAEAVGIGTATLKRWRKQEAFTSEFRSARRRVLEDAYAKLQSAASKAVATLVDAMDSESEHLKVKAALGILDRAQKGLEAYDLVERLEHLEDLLELRREGGHDRGF
jgi:Helix-turn-helix of insertion element transposase